MGGYREMGEYRKNWGETEIGREEIGRRGGGDKPIKGWIWKGE